MRFIHISEKMPERQGNDHTTDVLVVWGGYDFYKAYYNFDRKSWWIIEDTIWRDDIGWWMEVTPPKGQKALKNFQTIPRQ